MNKFLIMIPTFNERESIKDLIDRIEQKHLILVIDDNSPDKTAEYVKSLNYDNVDILKRPRKDGLGNAYKAGIKFALQKTEITHLVSMDADGSHRAEDLLRLIEIANNQKNTNLIMGSRWVPGGEIRNWSRSRIWISKIGTWYAKWALKIPINDLTGGFRIYPRWVLEKMDFKKIRSNGYCFQIEMAFASNQIINQSNGKIIEVPITFVERQHGTSKMNAGIVLEAMAQVTRLGLWLRIKPNADKLHYVK